MKITFEIGDATYNKAVEKIGSESGLISALEVAMEKFFGFCGALIIKEEKENV